MEMAARPAGRAPASSARRKSATDRRAELIGIGLRLLVDTPIHELSIDQVAEQAGISRGLLFHYFDTKADYYVAVIDAAARRMLDQAKDSGVGTSRERLREIAMGLTAFIRRRTRNYVALVRGATGGDERVAEVVRAARSELSVRLLHAAGVVTPTAWQQLTARGWLAMVEEIAIEGDAHDFPTETLVDRLLDNLVHSLEAPGPG